MIAPTYRAKFLGGLLRRVGHFGMGSFDDRLILQKIVYLMQASGIYLGYTFNWYIHGPYSTRLAADGFELQPIYSTLDEMVFDERSVEQTFKDFLQFIRPFRKEPEKLEIMASIHFLKQLHPHMKDSDVVAKVVAKQPSFTTAKVRKAWSDLCGFPPLSV
jgi:uncharacterized protein YwgA